MQFSSNGRSIPSPTVIRVRSLGSTNNLAWLQVGPPERIWTMSLRYGPDLSGPNSVPRHPVNIQPVRSSTLDGRVLAWPATSR